MKRNYSQQGMLFSKPKAWTDHWRNMPEFTQESLESWKSLKIHVRGPADLARLGELIEQKLTKGTRSVWFPEAEIGRYADKHYVSAKPLLPKYPVYIISKGRWKSRLTTKALERIGVPYRIVVEPQEFKSYADEVGSSKILTLPFSNLGKGSIPARNWVWEHSISEGHERHWILDDNIAGFYRLNRNLKTPVGDGTVFHVSEEFVDRYSNVAISGFHYFMFASRKSIVPPFYLNTRVYSCILLNNFFNQRWRGRYNEDTDLSIRALKEGWCSVLFNAFLAGKSQTMTMKGGNTDELYKNNGRLLMAQSLQMQHPDIVTVTEKWGRPQHHVDYRGFRRNKLKPKEGVEIPDGSNDYGMELLFLDGQKVINDA